MRKHNKRFAERFGRPDDDRTNFPQTMAHTLVKDKSFQYHANTLLQRVLSVVIRKAA